MTDFYTSESRNSDIPYTTRISKAPSNLTDSRPSMIKNPFKSSILSTKTTSLNRSFLPKNNLFLRGNDQKRFNSVLKRDQRVLTNFTQDQNFRDTKLTFDSVAVQNYISGNSRRVIISQKLFKKEHKFLFCFRKYCSAPPHDNASCFLKAYFSTEIVSVVSNYVIFLAFLPENKFSNLVSTVFILGIFGLIYCYLKAIKHTEEWGSVSDQILDFSGKLSVFFNFLSFILNFLAFFGILAMTIFYFFEGNWGYEFRVYKSETEENEYWLAYVFLVIVGINLGIVLSQILQYFKFFREALDNLILDYKIYLEIFDSNNSQFGSNVIPEKRRTDMDEIGETKKINEDED